MRPHRAVTYGTAVCALALIACGPQSIGDLPRPALVVTVTEGGGFCAATYVVDADDQVWLASGCETSSALVRQERVVSASERAELDALMDGVLALPADPGCDAPSPSARRFRFVRTLPGTEEWPESVQCEPTVDADTRELVLRMEALVATSGDGGTADGG